MNEFQVVISGREGDVDKFCRYGLIYPMRNMFVPSGEVKMIIPNVDIMWIDTNFIGIIYPIEGYMIDLQILRSTDLHRDFRIKCFNTSSKSIKFKKDKPIAKISFYRSCDLNGITKVKNYNK